MSNQNKKIKICFIPHSGPDFLGGLSMFHKNLINYIKNSGQINKFDITWVYFGNENKEYDKEEIHYIERKHLKLGFLSSFFEKFTFPRILKNRNFDVVSSGAGIWSWFYKKPKNQKLIHTYHGTIYYFTKNRIQEFSKFKQFLLKPLLWEKYLGEKPTKKTNKIICVSEKVREQIKSLYKFNKPIPVIRTGVDLKDFKPRSKESIRKKLKLSAKKKYGLYIGGGGYWTKGLDSAVKLSKEIYNQDKDYRLIIIGPDYSKVKHLIDKEFITFLVDVPRSKIPFYYNAANIFFCLSRYEGGAPTMVVSEAMASGCLIVSSDRARQEILKHEKNSLIVNNFDEKDAKKILNTLNNKKNLSKILKNSMNTIKEISIDKWGKKYLELLLD